MAYQDSERTELDYSPSSSTRGSTDGNYDATAGDYHYGRDKTVTTFNPNDGDDGRVRRECHYRDKWSWLAQLNDGVWAQNRREQNAAANLERDVEVACRALDAESVREESADSSLHRNEDSTTPREGHAELDRERILLVIEHARRQREAGLQFGQNKPLEATILAAISLVANEHDWPIRRDETFEDLRDSFTPSDMTVEKDDIRFLRKELREYL